MEGMQKTVEASLLFAKASHLPLHKVAKLRTRASAAKLMEEIAIIAKTTPQDEDFEWEDHTQASAMLWELNTISTSFEYSPDQLTVAATLATAELEASRGMDPSWVAQRIGGLLEAVNDKLVGFWQGRLVGGIRFLSSAAAFNGTTFDGALVRQEGWGLVMESDIARMWQAYRDMADFPSSLHLLAWRIGAWPMKLTGTLTEMPLGWAINYLLGVVAKIPPQLQNDPQQEASSSAKRFRADDSKL